MGGKTVDSHEQLIIGVDIGGTKTAVCLGSAGGEVLEKELFATESTPNGTIARITDIINGFSRKKADGGPAAVGISCGGPLDSRKGLILSPPNLPGWDEIPLVAILKQETGLPCYLENDANACVLAEWYWGNGKGFENLIFLTFGTGLGAGLILNGALYGGTSGLAGEIGHVRMAEEGPFGYGKHGSWEGFCSGGGLAKAFQSLYGEELSGKDICLRAEAADSRAKAVTDESARYLGRGLAMLIDILNPECIIIGSIFSRSEELFRPIMERIIKEEALPQARLDCRILPSGLGDSLGDRAALGVAINGIEHER